MTEKKLSQFNLTRLSSVKFDSEVLSISSSKPACLTEHLKI